MNCSMIEFTYTFHHQWHVLYQALNYKCEKSLLAETSHYSLALRWSLWWKRFWKLSELWEGVAHPQGMTTGSICQEADTWARSPRRSGKLWTGWTTEEGISAKHTSKAVLGTSVWLPGALSRAGGFTLVIHSWLTGPVPGSEASEVVGKKSQFWSFTVSLTWFSLLLLL